MGKDQELAIIFADVVGSTRLFESLGDDKARDLVTTSVELMRIATGQHGGLVIKTIGDEIMATFESCDDAVDAAAQMHSDIAKHPELRFEGQPITIRIGGHYGPVVIENNDVFGAAVHTANRMTSAAKAGQIIVSDALFARLAREWKDSVRPVDVAVPRGQHGEVILYEVLWEKSDVTSMVPTIVPGIGAKPMRLKLRYLDREIVLDGKDVAAVSIGRAEENDLCVKGNLVSRLHARIEAAKSRFVLVDQSTNGSFVQSSSGEEAFIRRDTLPLKGEGSIGFGRVPEPGSSHTIRYICEEIV